MSVELNTVPDLYNTAIVSCCVAEFVACLVFDSVLQMNGARVRCRSALNLYLTL